MDLQDSLVLSAEQITSLYIIKYGAKQPVSDAGGNSLYAPRSFQLSQNYPNPFNPSTKIDFRTSEPGRVVLRVYNLLGEEVATLVNEVKQPGRYEVTWDAREQPSGVYFCRLLASEMAITQRMILTR